MYNDETDVISDFDMFFYYGQNDLDLEIKSDVYITVMQPDGILFYSRSRNGAGVQRYENIPNTVVARILIPFAIVNALAKRNLDVSPDNPNRQIAISQANVSIQQKNNEIDVTVEYIPLYNYKKSAKLTARI